MAKVSSRQGLQWPGSPEFMKWSYAHEPHHPVSRARGKMLCPLGWTVQSDPLLGYKASGCEHTKKPACQSRDLVTSRKSSRQLEVGVRSKISSARVRLHTSWIEVSSFSESMANTFSCTKVRTAIHVAGWLKSLAERSMHWRGRNKGLKRCHEPTV